MKIMTWVIGSFESFWRSPTDVKQSTDHSDLSRYPLGGQPQVGNHYTVDSDIALHGLSHSWSSRYLVLPVEPEACTQMFMEKQWRIKDTYYAWIHTLCHCIWGLVKTLHGQEHHKQNDIFCMLVLSKSMKPCLNKPWWEVLKCCIQNPQYWTGDMVDKQCFTQSTLHHCKGIVFIVSDIFPTYYAT